MRKLSVTLGENGRMIIPAIFRKQLGIKPGDELIVKLSEENDIIVHSPRQSLHKIQNALQNSSGNLVNELFEMRKNEDI